MFDEDVEDDLGNSKKYIWRLEKIWSFYSYLPMQTS